MNADFFDELLNNYTSLKRGPRAELRRAATPEALRNLPIYHRLAHGLVSDAMLRTVFILGGIDPKQFTAEKITVGKAFANTDIGTPKENRLTPVGVRLVQVDRATDGRDIKQLRRLIDYLEPGFCWSYLANTLYYWDQERVKEGKSLPTNKKQMLEDYFRAKYTSTSN